MITKEDFQTMSKEHHQWVDEHQAWVEEVQQWRKEHDEVLQLLFDIDKSIRAHDATLRFHSNAVQDMQETIETREHRLLAHEKDFEKRTTEELKELEKLHEAERLEHNKHQKAHDRTRSYHEAIMSLRPVLEKISKEKP